MLIKVRVNIGMVKMLQMSSNRISTVMVFLPILDAAQPFSPEVQDRIMILK